MSLRYFLFVVIGFVLCVTQAMGQARLGIKGGISAMQEPTSSLLINDEGGTPAFELSVDNVKYGVHLGLFVQAQFSVFYIQPELLFNSQTVDYRVTDLKFAWRITNQGRSLSQP